MHRGCLSPLDLRDFFQAGPKRAAYSEYPMLMNPPPEVPDNTPSKGIPVDRRSIVSADIESRLRNICANFSDEDFRDLVDLMTDRKLKSERIKLT